MTRETEPNVLWENLCLLAGVPPDASIDRVHKAHPSVGRGTIQRIKDGGRGQGNTLEKLAAQHGLPAAALLTPQLGKNHNVSAIPGLDGSTVFADSGKAHPVILAKNDDPPLLQWGELVRDVLPEAFRLAMVDNAMAPRAPAGTVVHFRRASEARQGAGVLVRDGAGYFYFRRLQQRTPQHWRAVAINEDAAGPLDSIEDSLQIVAVMTAIETDWSEGY